MTKARLYRQANLENLKFGMSEYEIVNTYSDIEGSASEGLREVNAAEQEKHEGIKM